MNGGQYSVVDRVNKIEFVHPLSAVAVFGYVLVVSRRSATVLRIGPLLEF